MTSSRIGPIALGARRSLMVVVLVGSALGVAGGAAGAKPAPSSAPTTEPPTVAPIPKRWDPRIAPIAHEVEKLRKLFFEHPVAVKFLSDAAFEKKVGVDKGKLTAADKREARQAQSQLRAVGLIGNDVDLLDATSSLQKSGVL